jgi:hypothetical protein
VRAAAAEPPRARGERRSHSLGRRRGGAEGSVAWWLRAAAHPIYTRTTNILGASVSEAITRRNPRRRRAWGGGGACGHSSSAGGSTSPGPPPPSPPGSKCGTWSPRALAPLSCRPAGLVGAATVVSRGATAGRAPPRDTTTSYGYRDRRRPTIPLPCALTPLPGQTARRKQKIKRQIKGNRQSAKDKKTE